MNKDKTNHAFFTFNNDLPQSCIDILVMIGLFIAIYENEYGYRNDIKSKLSLLHPKQHIPSINLLNNINMSPCEG